MKKLVSNVKKARTTEQAGDVKDNDKTSDDKLVTDLTEPRHSAL